MLSSTVDSLEKMSLQEECDSQFSPFHDYLGLVNLILPASSIQSIDSPSSSENGSIFDYPQLASRTRMDSLDSDAISDSSSSVGSRSDTEMSYESLTHGVNHNNNVSNDLLQSFPQQTIPDLHALTQSYAKTLETIIAHQKNSLNRLSPQVTKEKSGKTNSGNKATVCVFCRNNGESREFYSSHTLKDNDGNTTCPILRAYTCPLCKANGDNSHTIKYCPKYTPKLKTDKLLGLAF